MNQDNEIIRLSEDVKKLITGTASCTGLQYARVISEQGKFESFFIMLKFGEECSSISSFLSERVVNAG